MLLSCRKKEALLWLAGCRVTTTVVLYPFGEVFGEDSLLSRRFLHPEQPSFVLEEKREESYVKQEGISVECHPPAYRQYGLHSEQVWKCREVGRGACLCAVRSKLHKFDYVWGGPGPGTCRGNEVRMGGPSWEGAGVLYRDLHCAHTDTTRNITFLQLRWRSVI